MWQTFTAPSFDDKILEVVAVFGSMQMAVSRVINLQHHRIAQVSAAFCELFPPAPSPAGDFVKTFFLLSLVHRKSIHQDWKWACSGAI